MLALLIRGFIMTQAIYQQVTDSIIAQLEQGAPAWAKCWQSADGAPSNLISGKNYNGINTLILALSASANGFASSQWATYQQHASKGYQVQKGQKATTVVFYKPVAGKVDSATGELSNGYAVLKAYSVFNLAQTDAPIVEATPRDSFEAVAECEARIIETGADIRHGGDSAYYQPASDFIMLPSKADFNTPSHYYATAFHELAHWTGAKHRLGREFGGRFGDEAYAFEELIAELSASFLCATHNITGDLRHAGYIQNWLRVLRDDNRAIFKASAMAQKATDYILARSTADEALSA
jgi:antirestriction protein ArdC